ncbi:MAG: PaaI family thioesterase [Verrucomicrobia bacterium]|nr:PaaI family thioesterase [Verrucomicrobiota bacterium]
MKKALPRTHSCFVCGIHNPKGLRLSFETDGNTVTGRFTPGEELVGFRGVIHGGILMTVLDEVMVWACGVAAKRFAFSAELTVRFLKPVRPGEELLARAWVAANRRGKIFEVEGELLDETGARRAAAKGKYMPVPDDIMEELAEDMVEERRP